MDHPKSKFQFGMTEIELLIWDIPSLIWDMVEFGLQQAISDIVTPSKFAKFMLQLFNIIYGVYFYDY